MIGRTLLGLLLAAPIAAWAQEADGQVVGVVFAQGGGAPVAGLRVEVGPASDTTDADGRFALSVGAGTWPVVVRGADGAPRAAGEIRVTSGHTSEVLVTWTSDVATLATTTEAPPADAAPVVDDATLPRGVVEGRIVSEADGLPLRGARVFVRGRSDEAVTDADGRFSIPLPIGTWELSIVAGGHAAQAIPDVAITEGDPTAVSIALVPAGLALEDFMVRAPKVTGNTAALLDDRRDAAGVTESIGAEQMKKSGDSNAAAALRRVTGLTVIGGRFVFVRGLGDRYSATLLNGSTLPSPEPERRTVPLDLFPTSVLESVVVQKTFSPDRPAEFGGGIVQIRTRTMPTSPIFQVSGTLGYTSGSTFTRVPSGARGPTDVLGFGRKFRELPAEIQALGGKPIEPRGLLNPDGMEDDEIERLGESFANRWDTQDTTTPPDGSLQISWGDSWQVGGKHGPRIGTLLGLNWGLGTDVADGIRNVYSVSDGETVLQRATTYRELTQRVLLGGIGVVGASWGKEHEISSTTLLNRISEYGAGLYDADDPTSDSDKRATALTWTEQQLLFEQLAGHHVLSKDYPALLDWRYAFSEARRWEPDRREYTYARGVDGYYASTTGSWNEITDGALADRNHDVGLDVTLPFWHKREDAGLVKIGGLVMARDRSSDLRRFGYQIRGADIDLARPLGEILTPENIGATDEEDGSYLYLTEIQVSTDDYTARQRMFAGYGMVEIPFFKRFQLMTGARVEASTQTVSTFQLNNPELTPVDTRLATIDALPAATLSIAVGPGDKRDDMLVRMGYGRTVSRPEFRELAPVPYVDARTGTIVFGEPGLKRALIDNVDVRWEWYFKPGQSVSVAGFYKHFNAPIETVALPIAGSNTSQTLRNAESARNFGVEADFRLGWGIFHPKLTDMYIAGNAAYIDSRIVVGNATDSIDTNSERPLQGQSPWVVNAQLGYDNPDLGVSVSLLYNVFGPRITDVGQQGIPDTYEMPVHRLDLVALAPLTKGFQAQFRATNLLDWPVRQQTGGALAQEERQGVSLRLGLQWSR